MERALDLESGSQGSVLALPVVSSVVLDECNLSEYLLSQL